MNNQKKILLIVLVLLIIAVVLFFIFRKGDSENKTDYTDIQSINIVYSDLSVSMDQKDINITDKNTIQKITKLCSSFESAKDDNVSTSIINNYIVKLEDKVTIYMDSTVYNYGYVKYKNSENLEFVKLPEGLLECIKEVVENN